MQVCVGSCSLDDIAVKVVATVISHKPEVRTLVTDCGWLAIGQDGMERTPSDVPLGYTPVVGHPELRFCNNFHCFSFSMESHFIMLTISDTEVYHIHLILVFQNFFSLMVFLYMECQSSEILR